MVLKNRIQFVVYSEHRHYNQGKVSTITKGIFNSRGTVYISYFSQTYLLQVVETNRTGLGSTKNQRSNLYQTAKSLKKQVRASLYRGTPTPMQIYSLTSLISCIDKVILYNASVCISFNKIQFYKKLIYVKKGESNESIL